MKKIVPIALRVLLWTGAALVCAYCFEAYQVVRASHPASDATADAAIVLGAAAWGNKPSPVYRERILEAISLYKAHRVHWIVLTGGSSKPGYPSEASVGRRFCVARGVPVEATLVDEASRTTWQNLDAAKQLMRQHGIRTAVLVSDPLHMRRAMVMAQGLGLQALPAPTGSSRYRSWLVRARFLWRETWLSLAYVIFGVKI